MPAPGGSRESRPARRAPPRVARAMMRKFMELRTSRLRQRLVGGVPNEKMAEPVAVLSGELRLLRRTRSFRTSAVRIVERASPRPRAATAPRWKTSPSTDPRSSTRRSDGSSWSSRAASSAWIEAGTATSAPFDCKARASISSTKSGFPPAARRIRDCSVASSAEPSWRLEISSSVSCSESGSRSTLVAFSLPPPQFGRLSSSSGRAMQRSSSAPHARDPRHARRARERRSRPTGCRRTGKSAAPRGLGFEQLAKRPCDLIGVAAAVTSASPSRTSSAWRAVPSESGSGAAGLLHDLHDRPVRDALAVGEAPSVHNGDVIEGAQELRHETCFSDARRSEHSEQVARALTGDVVEGVVQHLQMPRSADHGCGGRACDATGRRLHEISR